MFIQFSPFKFLCFLKMSIVGGVNFIFWNKDEGPIIEAKVSQIMGNSCTKNYKTSLFQPTFFPQKSELWQGQSSISLWITPLLLRIWGGKGILIFWVNQQTYKSNKNYLNLYKISRRSPEMGSSWTQMSFKIIFYFFYDE